MTKTTETSVTAEKTNKTTDVSRNIEELSMSLGRPQVAQARNISIGEHRHCCMTFEI